VNSARRVQRANGLCGRQDAHLLSAKQLKYLFIAVMFYMGLKMVGVFAWLNLPL